PASSRTRTARRRSPRRAGPSRSHRPATRSATSPRASAARRSRSWRACARRCRCARRPGTHPPPASAPCLRPLGSASLTCPVRPRATWRLRRGRRHSVPDALPHGEFSRGDLRPGATGPPPTPWRVRAGVLLPGPRTAPGAARSALGGFCNCSARSAWWGGALPPGLVGAVALPCIVRIVLLASNTMAPGRAPRTTLEYALIGLIRQMPRSGYELRKVFVETAMAGYSGSPGAIYPALRRLEADGLIEGTEQPGGPGRPRREYRLTPAGEAVLQAWLTLPVTRDDVALRLDEPMLRFAFLGFADSPGRTLDFLASLEAHLTAFLGDLHQQREAIREAPLHAQLALEAGISSIADRLRWTRAVRE